MSGSLGKEKVVGEKQILGKSKWLQLVDVKYVRDGQVQFVPVRIFKS